MVLTYTVKEEDCGKTVKHILKSRMELSERLVKKLKYSQHILLNSLPVYINVLVSTGDNIQVAIDFEEECDGIIPQDINIDIIYEDECIIAVNKFPNMVVHPVLNHQEGTVANALMFHYSLQGIKRKIRPVSRLDKGTSGIILFAGNQFVQESLIRQMNGKIFLKEYIGFVHGIIKQEKGTIDLPIDRVPGSIMQRHVSETGYRSITHYEVIECFKNNTFLKFILETGRTHQIRVHCHAIGHPLVGDTLYCIGNSHEKELESSTLISRQALHSHRVVFIHPLTKKTLELKADVPQDIMKLLEIFRK